MLNALILLFWIWIISWVFVIIKTVYHSIDDRRNRTIRCDIRDLENAITSSKKVSEKVIEKMMIGLVSYSEEDYRRIFNKIIEHNPNLLSLWQEKEMMHKRHVIS